MDIVLLKTVAGGPELLDWFDGHAAGFHDAEVLSIAFDRAGPTCLLRVHGFGMTSRVNADGSCVLDAHAVVTFRIDEISAMQLDGFNHQNALFDLSVVRATGGGIRIEIEPAYGLSGFIEGQSLSISIEPDVPPDSQYEAQPSVR